MWHFCTCPIFNLILSSHLFRMVKFQHFMWKSYFLICSHLYSIIKAFFLDFYAIIQVKGLTKSILILLIFEKYFDILNGFKMLTKQKLLHGTNFLNNPRYMFAELYSQQENEHCQAVKLPCRNAFSRCCNNLSRISL